MKRQLKPPRNEHARALHTRAGHAGAAIRIDTRPKVIKPEKGRASYRRRPKHKRLESASGFEAFSANLNKHTAH